MAQRRAVRARVHKFDATGEISAGPDSLAGEEPLEVRLNGEQFSVTMRTPGNDIELVAGYLLSEAIITTMADIEEIDFSTGLAPDGTRNHNVAQRAVAARDLERRGGPRPIRLHFLLVWDLWHRGHRRGDEDLRLPPDPGLLSPRRGR